VVLQAQHNQAPTEVLHATLVIPWQCNFALHSHANQHKQPSHTFNASCTTGWSPGNLGTQANASPTSSQRPRCRGEDTLAMHFNKRLSPFWMEHITH